MKAEKDPFDLPPEIQAAFDAYPKPGTPLGFEARFWAHYADRRGRYRGLVGWLRRLVEVEIEGVAVWRLAASTLSGGALCALLVGLLVLSGQGTSNPTAAKIPLGPAPVPADSAPSGLGALAFYNREWELDLDSGDAPRRASRRPSPPTPLLRDRFNDAGPRNASPRHRGAGGEFSWAYSNEPVV